MWVFIHNSGRFWIAEAPIPTRRLGQSAPRASHGPLFLGDLSQVLLGPWDFLDLHAGAEFLLASFHHFGLLFPPLPSIPCISSDSVLLHSILRNVSPPGAPSVNNPQLCQTEAKPLNPFSFMTYIAIGSRGPCILQAEGEMLLWQQIPELQGGKTPTLKKSSLTHMANGLH